MITECPCGGRLDTRYNTWSHAESCWKEQHRRETVARERINETPVTVAELEFILRGIASVSAASLINRLAVRRGVLKYDHEDWTR